MSIIKIKTGLFTNLASKDSKPKIRSKSIAILKKTSSKIGNTIYTPLNKSNTITRINANNVSPKLLHKEYNEIVSPMTCFAKNSIISLSQEKFLKSPLHFHCSAKSESNKLKKNIYKKRSANISSRKKNNDPPRKFIHESIDNNYNLTTPFSSKPISTEGVLLKPRKFFSSSNLENIVSADLPETPSPSFKGKLLQIFASFKENHLKILKKFKKSK